MSDNRTTVGIGEWIGVFVLSCIPLVNIIMLLVWAFGNAKPSKKNYARATLILALIGVVLWIIGAIIAAAVGFSLADLSGGLSSLY
ncbi:MAG: hypothetical protein PHO66_02665 [Eubacteriales bacterium]|nr:hypothetical protein [Eubacteriales bacterium]